MSNRLGQFEKLTRASAPVLVQSQFFFFVLFSGLIVDPGRHWNPFILDSEHSKKTGETHTGMRPQLKSCQEFFPPRSGETCFLSETCCLCYC